MATACFLLLTGVPLFPLFKVPFSSLCIARLTDRCALLPYLAMILFLSEHNTRITTIDYRIERAQISTVKRKPARGRSYTRLEADPPAFEWALGLFPLLEEPERPPSLSPKRPRLECACTSGEKSLSGPPGFFVAPTLSASGSWFDFGEESAMRSVFANDA